MKFYYENNQCFIGNLIVSQGSIDVKYKESDTKVEIFKHGTNLNYFNGLIADLEKKNGLNYIDKASLDAALPDFFDVIGAFIISSATLLTNSIIHIVLSKAGYGDNGASLPIDVSDVSFAYVDNSDTLIDAEILALSDTSGDPLTGGETEFYIHNYLEGQSDGNGTIEVTVNTDAIFDSGGTAMADTETTGVLTLSAETIDFIPNLKGVNLYMDANDAATVDEITDFIWTDKSNNGFDFSQSNASLKPTNNIATTQAIDFDRGDYLETDTPVMLDDSIGFSLWITFYRVAGDQRLITSSANIVASNETSIAYILVRATSILINIAGGNVTFTYTVPINQDITLEFRYYDGSFYLYENNVLKATTSYSKQYYLYFNRIASDNTSQGLQENLRNITVYNDIDATVRTAIYNKIKAKYIDQTELSNVSRVNYLIPTEALPIIGDSQVIGRDVTGSLTAPFQYVLGDQTVTVINNALTYNADTRYLYEASAAAFGYEAACFYWALQESNSFAIMKYGRSGATCGTSTIDYVKANQTAYPLMIKNIWGFLQFMKSQMFDYTFDKMVIELGTNDSSTVGLPALYEANQNALNVNIRADLNLPNLKILSFNCQSGAGQSVVNAAKDAIAISDSNFINSNFTDTMAMFDALHYNADSCVKIGEYIYKNWFKL